MGRERGLIYSEGGEVISNGVRGEEGGERRGDDK